tara:strand:- start:53 stop:349 length:297 start_codon:yes stop_codon:yes gene_type:complete
MTKTVTLVYNKPDAAEFYVSTDAMKARYQALKDTGQIVSDSLTIDGNTKTFVVEFLNEAAHSSFLAEDVKINDNTLRTNHNTDNSIFLEINTSTDQQL